MKKDNNYAVVVGWDAGISGYARNMPPHLEALIMETVPKRIGELSATRDYILRRWPPKYRNVYARHITLQRGVGPGVAIPIVPQRITVWGTVDGPGYQALAVMLGDPSVPQVAQPNGKPYHITISVADGTPPGDAGRFTWDQVKHLDTYEEMWGYAHLLPTWKITPEQREIALVG